MILSIRHTKGLGNSTVYIRIRNDSGSYWNFVSSSWVTPEVANCRVLMTEVADTDTVESRYYADVTIPSGGVWTAESVDLTNNLVVGEEPVMGELSLIPTGNASWIQKIQYLFQYFAFRKNASNTAENMFKEDASTPLATSTISDNGTTTEKGKML